MKIENLKIFLEVVRAGSIHEAARNLYMSHQNLIKIIKNMEAELNTPLFVRTRKGVQLNASGNEVFVTATQIVENYETMLKKLKIDSDVIKLYITPTFSTLAGELQGNCFDDKYLSIYKRDASEIKKMLERGESGIYFMSTTNEHISISERIEKHTIASSNLCVQICHQNYVQQCTKMSESSVNKFITNAGYDKSNLSSNGINIDDMQVCKRLMKEEGFSFYTEQKLYDAEFSNPEWAIIDQKELSYNINYTVFFNIPETIFYQNLKEQIIQKISAYFKT